MKALITSVNYQKEIETKFGITHIFRVGYDGKDATYFSKKKEQDVFVVDKESEFTETVKTSDQYGEQITIKPIMASNFGRQTKREQSKYSGFAMSYAKDLVIGGRISLKEMPKYTKAMFNLMVELDKTLES